MQATAQAPVKKGRLTLPERIVVCPWGERKDLTGKPVIVNETTLRELGANQAAAGHSEIALDFEHSTVPRRDADGKVVKPTEPQAIAAMGSLTVEPGVGIIFHPLSWTPEGENFYTGRHYRDLSPTIKRNDKGEVVFLQSVALTRTGQIEDLHAFSSDLEAAGLTALSTPIPNTMETNNDTKPDYRALLIESHNLDSAATDEEILAAVAAKKEAKEKPEPMGAEKKEEKPEPMSAPASAGDDVTALSARQDKIERKLLLDGAARDGKMIPLSAEALETTPLSVLEEIVKNLPAGAVPLQSGGIAKEPEKLAPLSAEEQVVADRMGLTAEQYRAGKD